MLRQLGNIPMQYEAPMKSHSEDRWQRNEIEDMKKGIEYLYEFREKICKLHPVILDVIENMLQRPRY